MKVWIVARFIGGLPGESDVDVYDHKKKAKEHYDRIVSGLKSENCCTVMDTIEEKPDSFYYDSGDYWEMIRIQERKVL